MHAKYAQKGGPRYRCSWRAKVGGHWCRGGIGALHLEAQVWDLVCRLSLEPEQLLSDYVAGYEALNARQRRQRAQLAAAQAETRKYQDALDRMALAFYSGELAREQYDRVRQLAEAQLAAAQEQCRTVMAQTDNAGRR